MRVAIVNEATGRIVSVAQAPDGYIEDQVPQGHLGVPLDTEERVSDATHEVVDGAVVRRKKPAVTPEVKAAEAQFAIAQEEALSLRALREAVLELSKEKPNYNHPSLAKLAASDVKIGKLRKTITAAGK